MQDVLVPVSPGELLDKITILRIKSQRITDATKLANVRHELALLERTWSEAVPGAAALAAHERRLEEINAKLWDVEDQLRELEAAKTFDAKFIELARAVYYTNDERAAVKKKINLALGSQLVEEKSYQQYS